MEAGQEPNPFPIMSSLESGLEEMCTCVATTVLRIQDSSGKFHETILRMPLPPQEKEVLRNEGGNHWRADNRLLRAPTQGS